MTQLTIPVDGIQLSANDIVAMWHKEGIHILNGLEVTHAERSITVSAGSIQLDGTAFESTQDVVFDIAEIEDATYIVFLVSNRTNTPQYTWTSLTCADSGLFYPIDKIDYNEAFSIPAMSTRLAIGVILNRIDNAEPILDRYTDTRGLVAFPIWSHRNGKEYYYPSGYDVCYVMRNTTHFYGLGVSYLDIESFNTIIVEGNFTLNTGETELALNLGLSSYTINTNIVLDGVNVIYSGGYIRIPVATDDTRCAYKLNITKVGAYLFLYGVYNWGNGNVRRLTGQVYFTGGLTTYIANTIAHSSGFASGEDAELSDFRLRVT